MYTKNKIANMIILFYKLLIHKVRQIVIHRPDTVFSEGQPCASGLPQTV